MIALFAVAELDHMRTGFQFPVAFGSLFSQQSEQLDCLMTTSSSSSPSTAESLTTAGVIGSQRQPCLLYTSDAADE